MIIVLAFVISAGSNAHADFTFGEPINLGPTINSPHSDYSGSFSSDGLEMYFDSNRSGGSWNSYDIYVSRRATTDDAWGTPVKFGPPVNSSSNDFCPVISTDGLSLYFTSLNRAGGYGVLDIWVTTRETVDDDWDELSNLGPTINTSQDEHAGSISCDGLVLYFYQKPPPSGPAHIYMSTRPTTNDAWGESVNLRPTVNSASGQGLGCISPNGLLLFFYSKRPGGFGDFDLYVTRRATIDDDWGIPVNLGPTINTSASEASATILPDGSTLYFTSNRPGGVGGTDIYQAPIFPIVDFNGDGIVDAADMCIMVDHWGEDYSLCDVGPTPFGDGVVDIEDLKVIAEHLFEEVDDPTLLAHWKLDEEAGNIAYDSVGTNDGTIIGSPQWRLENGAVDGALELNGTTFIAFDPVLNPADGPFSVLVWVKGGGPGQVIASSGRINWLMADAATGALMTELSNVGQNGGSLGPEAVITDGNWHRIAFTWDGANARLYVDTLLVVEDVQDGLINSSARLLLGTSIGRDPGSYWSGLIDDVRIYNRAVNP